MSKDESLSLLGPEGGAVLQLCVPTPVRGRVRKGLALLFRCLGICALALALFTSFPLAYLLALLLPTNGL